MKSLHVVGVAARPVSDLLLSALDVCATDTAYMIIAGSVLRVSVQMGEWLWCRPSCRCVMGID